jgi:hypothetical protein
VAFDPRPLFEAGARPTRQMHLACDGSSSLVSRSTWLGRCGCRVRSCRLARARSPKEAVSYVGYNEARLRARVQERSYAFAGAFLLVSGFMLQLVGYAWTFSAWWMLGYAIAITVLAIFAALRSVKRLGSTFHARADELMRKAVE